MKKFVVFIFFNAFLFFHLVGQNQSAFQTKITGSRFSISQQIEFQHNIKNSFLAIGVGYDIGRAIQYQHFAPSVQLGYAHALIQHEKLSVLIQINQVTLFRLYPSNSNLTLHSTSFGYALSYGARWQLIQELGLGMALLSPSMGSKQLVHDFRFSFGVRRILSKN
jgi:hypothetical protein